MEYLSLSRRRERVETNYHWRNGSGMRLRRLEWNGGKTNVEIIYRQQIYSLDSIELDPPPARARSLNTVTFTLKEVYTC